jgi:hypothetical protein
LTLHFILIKPVLSDHLSLILIKPVLSDHLSLILIKPVLSDHLSLVLIKPVLSDYLSLILIKPVLSDHLSHCESTFIRWHQFSWFLQNALIYGFFISWFQNITGNNQWENCTSLDFYFHDFSGPWNQQKLELHD